MTYSSQSTSNRNGRNREKSFVQISLNVVTGVVLHWVIHNTAPWACWVHHDGNKLDDGTHVHGRNETTVPCKYFWIRDR